jgi:hypothetical protein
MSNKIVMLKVGFDFIGNQQGVKWITSTAYEKNLKLVYVHSHVRMKARPVSDTCQCLISTITDWYYLFSKTTYSL